MANYTEVKGKLFFNRSCSPTATMRVAAKKFVTTPEFDEDHVVYNGDFVNRRWVFSGEGVKPVKTRLSS
jgi:hypothetical protein